METPVTNYRRALSRLREVSRALADGLEKSEDSQVDVAEQERVAATLTRYNRILKECHDAFGRVPARFRDKVPSPPPV
jgi:hypothetical protein